MKVRIRRLPAKLGRGALVAAATGAFILILVLAVQVARLSRQVDQLASGIRAEVEAQNRLGMVLESNQRTVTSHLSEVRRLMNLSPGTYSFGSREPTEGDSATAGPDAPINERYYTNFFQAIGRITAERELRELEAQLREAVPAALELFTRENKLSVRRAGRLTWRIETPDDAGAPALLTLRAGPDALHLESVLGEVRTIQAGNPNPPAALPDVERAAWAELSAIREAQREFAAAQRAVQELINAPETRAALDAAALTIGPPTDTSTSFRAAALTPRTREAVFEFGVDLRGPLYHVDGVTTADQDAFARLLRDRIAQSDPRTAAQRHTDAAIRALRSMAADAAFAAHLRQNGLELSTEPRETLDFYFFDLTHAADGSAYGAFAVQKELGEIFVMDADEVIISALAAAGTDPLAALRAEPGGGAPGEDRADAARRDRALPNDFPPGFRAAGTVRGTNIALIGTHEGKSDAIILAHLSNDRTISMVSIPRDIWWENRKLSDLSEIYGTEYAVQQLSRIVGQPIDGWVAVDMYAFIQVVDLLGGIELTLSEPLIDPTYRVRNGNEWSTLFYDTGTHHLGGVEALRIARSRHTTTDFGRSQRQHAIIEALRRQANQLHAGDLDRVYRLFETLNRYVTSSFSAWELAQFFLAYRNAPIVRREGLTYDNVLYSTYSNVHVQGLDFEELEEDFFLGAWILLPRGDDWSVVHWCVEEALRR